MTRLVDLRDALAAGRTTSTALVEAALERARDPAGEGPRVYLTRYDEQALAAAAAVDAQRGRGEPAPPWAGIPVSVKDLFDRAGETTRAGSRILAGAPAARRTAPAIERLLAAGFIPVGRTNMTEFAYSGLGLNPHYGTPRNPFEREVGRIPGGSSSGAAVSVTDGMAAAAIGTDTGGSCRIPAALTGLTGFKPTADRIPREGVYPLSPSLDSVGPLAHSVSCCAVIDDVLAGGRGESPQPPTASTLRLAVLTHYVTDDLEPAVADAYGNALRRLAQAGADLVDLSLPEIEVLPTLNAGGGLVAAEAYAHHQAQLATAAEQYDPRVADRIAAGAAIDAARVAEIRRERVRLVGAFAAAMDGFDALLAPTVPIVAPPLGALGTDSEYVRLNLLVLRNPSLVNVLDGCAVTVPIHDAGEAPVGLMMAAPGGRDRRLLGIAEAVEGIVRRVEVPQAFG
ncbi:MAG: amidase [Gemmatimonadota bacterium]